MVGTVNERMGNQQVTRLQTIGGIHQCAADTPIEGSPTCPRLSNLPRGQNGHLLALCKPALNYAQTTLY